jgi:pro-kumamolisin-like protein/IPT/TIG domain-containing protein/fibronectin type III domain protein
VKTTAVSTSFSRLVTLGAAGVVVASFMAAPASAAAVRPASMAPISANYAHVTRAPKLPAGTRKLGVVAASKTISGAVALAPRDPAGLEAAAAAVSNPRSTSFHKYIAKGTFAANYGPSQATIAAVEATLRSSHLAVTSVSSNHLLVHFSGTVGAADAAFRTNIASFQLASGRVGTETTQAVSLPASLSSSVVAVLGLDTLAEPHSNLVRATHPAAVKAVKATFTHPAGSATPCPAATTIANENGGLTDDQIAHAYGLDSLYSSSDFGAGQTVAIYELEPFSTSDILAFDKCYFGTTAANTMISHVSVKDVDGGSGTGPGSGESALDVENVSAIAPGANIEVYDGPNSNEGAGATDVYNAIVQDDTASVVSTSWGECEALEQSTEPGMLNVENEIFEQAALQGQSIFASSGDSGADDCSEQAPVPTAPTLSTDDPASQPFVTGAGGTTTTNAQQPPSQQVWNDGNIGGGGGGGVSSVWGAPSWQQPFLDTSSAASAVTNGGLSPCAQSPSTGALCREVPDVSANADEYTGGITVYIAALDGWNTFGGTSSSAPLWAGMMAEVNASSSCTSNVGFASPSLYAVAAVPADYSASFTDLTAGHGNNDVYDINNGQYFATRSGYDMASGLGTPMLAGPTGQAGLANYLCTLSAPAARPAISSLTPDTVTTTTPAGPVTITGTGFTGATALSVGGFNVPSGDWSVTDDTHISLATVPTGTQALTGSQGPQDGSGRAIVSVTGANGTSSLATDAGALLYVATSASSPDPSVEGITSFGGSQAGGNTVSVFGSGFSGVTDVTFGGVSATGITEVNENLLTMTVPAYDSLNTVCKSGDDTVNDVCQVQVVVTNGNGSSSIDPIHLPYTGAPFGGTVGGASEPACVTGNTCEVVPAETEYDYLPTPTITSVTTTSAADSTVWASEQGDTIATIDGSGFDYLGFIDGVVGNPALNANADTSVLSYSPTEIQLVINGRDPTTNPVSAGLRVNTLAGQSAPFTIRYAGVPKVSAVTPPFGPDLGGTTIGVTGKAFEGVAPADGGQIAYVYLDFGIAASQLSGYTANSDTSITASTPPSNPGAFVVEVCTVTSCSQPTSESSFENSIFDFYQPGAPIVTSVTKDSGPASGGTKVTIVGQNLADAFVVTFGKTVAEASNEPEILTNGSSTQVTAVVPPGKAGSTVHVRVATAESLATGHPASAPSAGSAFHYTSSVASPAQDVKAKKHGTAVTLTWKPPASNGGHKITKYRVSAVAQPNSTKKNAKTPPTVFVVTKHASARSAVLTGLRGGWVYRLEVQAINSAGRGLPGRPTNQFVFITDPA